MAYDFADTWDRRIASKTTDPRFQRSTVRFEDPSLLVPAGEYDVETGEQEFTGDPVIYEGQARIIAINQASFNRNDDQANPTTLKAIRIQIPNGTDSEGYGEDEYEEDPYAGGLLSRVKRGVKVYVIDNPRNPALNGLIFTISSDMQGSAAAARTFEAVLDLDVEVVSNG
jgi:hypothetical protein